MTNEKAKDLLDNLVGMVEDNNENDYDTSLKMGIRAIDTLEKIKAEIENIKDFEVVNGGLYVRQYDVAQIIDKYAEKEPPKDTTLKDIALELLQKYEESETSVIWEYSGDIAKSEENLDAEVAKYRELIDKYAEKEQIEVEYAKQQKAYNEGFEDCRKAVIKVVDKHTFDTDYGLCLDDDISCILEHLPSVNTQPCEDAVSRQNIIEQYKSCADMLSDEELEGANLVMEWVYKAQPVKPQEQEQKTGHWVEKKGPRGTYIECSECGGLVPSTEFADGVWFKKSNFCHECGAKMVDPQERR